MSFNQKASFFSKRFAFTLNFNDLLDWFDFRVFIMKRKKMQNKIK